MLEVSKGYTDMGINYKRRLGCGDSFLTTTIKGKRIEVKSDLLTENYNNKIMKNLKTMIEEFQSEAKSRIAKGEFETISSSVKILNGYIGIIDIKMDEVSFRFSLGSNNNICDHSDIKIYPRQIDEKELNVLKNEFYDFTKEDRDNQIKELQNKISELQK